MRLNKNNRVHKYRTRSVYTGSVRSALNLILLISPFTPSCWHLVVTCSQAQATQVDHKYSMKREIETHDVFYGSSASIETYSPLRGLRETQQRSALEDHEGHLAGVFQLLFPPSTSLIPSLVAVESNRYKFSEAHHNVLSVLRRCLAI